MKNVLFTFVLAVSILLSGSVFTQSAIAAQDPVLDEVVVTASRIEEKKKHVTANITVITAEEIKQSPARDLGDLFAEKGIGHVQKYPGSLTSIGLRGFRTDAHGNDLRGHVLVLLNGRRAGTGNLAKILTRNVERIEILRGPGAVQYGSAGMGGVINVITRQGTKNGLSLGIGYGSFEEKEISAGATARRGPFDFSGSVSYTSTDDYKTGDGDRFHNTGMDSRVGFSVNAGYTILPGNRVSFVLNGMDVDEAGSPGYLSQNDRDDYSDKKNISGDLIYEGAAAGGKLTWMARYFKGKDEDTWMDPTDSDPTGWDDGQPSKRNTDQQGAQLQVSTRLSFVSLTAGMDWTDYEVETTWTPEKTEYENLAGFLLAKGFLLNNHLIFSGGVRYDTYDLKVVQPAGRSEDDNHVSPTAGVAWVVTDALKFRARYAEAFVMPGADQLAADYTSFGRHIIGNADLDPETSDTWELGVDYSAGPMVSSLTWFSTDFSDKIETTTTADGVSSWRNLGSASLAGFEGELSFDLGQLLEWKYEVKPYLNFVCLTRFEDDETGRDLQYISEKQAAFGIAVSDYDGLSARLNVAYTGEQDVTNWETGGFPAPVVILPDFFVTDLVVSKRVYSSEKAGSLTVRGEVRNLFDENYAYIKGYPMPGIGFFIGLNWDY
jgi:vitamin B12 transporter